MKKNNSIKRGGAFALVELLIVTAIIALLAALLMPSTAHAGTYVPVQPAIYIDGTSNTTVNAGGTASPANWLAPNTTNYFNLSVTTGTQANTNLWPAVALGGKLGLSSKTVTIQTSFFPTSTNLTTHYEQWAGSTDGIHWVTNPCPIIITVTNQNSTNYSGALTDAAVGEWPYVSLYLLGNAGSTTPQTNLWLGSTSGKLYP